MTIHPDRKKLVIAFTPSEQHLARKFAQEQAIREKAKAVYLNTLAVLAVKHCLDILEIPSALEQSDSWNPFCRMGADLADLWIQGNGTLECRPIAQGETACWVPPEAQENRIGYVVVQLDPPYQDAEILGFTPTVTADQIRLSQLESLENLFIQIQVQPCQSPTIPGITCLSDWFQSQVATVATGAERVGHDLQGAIATTWKTLASFGSQPPANLEFAFRQFGKSALSSPEKLQHIVNQLYASQESGPGKIQLSMPTTAGQQPEAHFKAALAHLIQTTADEEVRWKAAEILWTLEPEHPATGIRRMMDVGLRLAGHAVALMVGVLRLENQFFSILVRLYPMQELSALPTGVKLSILGEDGITGLEAFARERDNYIQLKLRGTIGEKFSIQVDLDESRITEFCVI